MNISVVYVTFNESDKLRKSLESVNGFASEIVIIDLGSNDGIDKISKEFGTKLYSHDKVPYVELVRSYAISKATYLWVLVLDPDEIVPQKLSSKLKELSQSEQSNIAAVNIPRKNIFFGKWINHTNFWPDRQIRFFKKELVSWPKRIHTYPKVNGEIIDLPSQTDLAIWHYGYDNFADFWQRQKRYSSVEAANLYQEGRRFSTFRLFWNPLRIFLVRCIKHQGYLDGLEGIYLIVGLMYFSIVTEIKLLKLYK